ncbi:MAG: hypothetical protein ACK47E_00300 [Cyclobacteriaceae bacterium]|jgi:hypothetical protein
MKTLLTAGKYIFTILLSAAWVIWFSSCLPEPPDRVTDIILKISGKTWLISTVTVDGVDRTSSYAMLKLVFRTGELAYTTTSAKGDTGPVWPANGTMSRLSQTQVKRDDGVVMDVEFPSDTQMTLTFDWTTTDYGPGRAEGIKGRHVFKFTKQ